MVDRCYREEAERFQVLFAHLYNREEAERLQALLCHSLYRGFSPGNNIQTANVLQESSVPL